MGPQPDTEFFKQILEAVAHPVFVKDRGYRFVLVNRALCETVGFSMEEMLGKTDYDFFSREESDFFRSKDEELFRSGAPVDIAEEFITDAQGRRHVLATTKVPLRDANGEVTHLVGIIHDITRLKAAEEALRAANEELELRMAERTRELEAAQADLMRKERLAVLGQLAGGVAHQIRNPLAAIKNAAYVIERIGRSAAQSSEFSQALKVIHDEIDGANETITALLSHARVRPADRQPVPVRELIDTVLLSEDLPPNVRVEIDIPDLPDITVDRDQTKSALSNLLRNAVEALRDAGGVLQIRGALEGRAVAIRFIDTGPGLHPNVRDRLFEPLVTTKPLGLGLGLVTARTLLVGQGGQIEYEPAAVGAVFCVRLPIGAAAEASGGVSPVTVSPGPPSGEQVRTAPGASNSRRTTPGRK